MTQQPPVRLKAKENFSHCDTAVLTLRLLLCNADKGILSLREQRRPYTAMHLGYQIQGDTCLISSSSIWTEVVGRDLSCPLGLAYAYSLAPKGNNGFCDALSELWLFSRDYKILTSPPPIPYPAPRCQLSLNSLPHSTGWPWIFLNDRLIS